MNFCDIVKNREYEGGTIDDDLLPPQSGANEGNILGRSTIKGPDEPDPHRDEDYRDDDCQNNPLVNGHGTPPVGDYRCCAGSLPYPAATAFSGKRPDRAI
jgi:hypothetical protein